MSAPNWKPGGNFCPHCHNAVDIRWERCKNCGNELAPPTIICSSCRSAIDPRLPRCPNCREPLRTVTTTKTFQLRPDQEWHSEPLRLRPGDTVTVSARAVGRFYCGFFQREEYFRLYRAANGAFAFRAGGDSPGFTGKFTITSRDEHYLVLRVSVFGKVTSVSLTFTVEPSDTYFPGEIVTDDSLL